MSDLKVLSADLKVLTTENLEDMAKETEALLHSLHAELEKRRELAQEKEIEKLEGHLEDSEFSLKALKDFIDYLVTHMK